MILKFIDLEETVAFPLQKSWLLMVRYKVSGISSQDIDLDSPGIFLAQHQQV